MRIQDVCGHSTHRATYITFQPFIFNKTHPEQSQFSIILPTDLLGFQEPDYVRLFQIPHPSP